jgi:hypothetical protein
MREWVDTVANARLHGTTQRIVSEAFAAEKPELQPVPAVPFEALLKLERRVSHDGLVSIGGNYYSVPDRTRRVVEVHRLADQIRILDEDRLVASHPVLEGRRQYRIDPAHRQAAVRQAARKDARDIIVGRLGRPPLARLSTRPSANAWRSRGAGHDGQPFHDRQHQKEPGRAAHAAGP